jgi:hypothetical protein
MSRALFFQSAYFFENSPVDENTNYDLIQPVVWDSQQLFIKEILGSPLYDVIADEIISNGGTLTTARLLTLVNDYVAPCLLNYVLMDSQTTMLYKMRNQAVLKSRSDFGEPVDFKQHRYLKDEYKIKAEAYAEKIERYLCANSATFPEYLNYTSSDQVRAKNQRPSTSVFLGGLNIPNNYGEDYYKNK